MNLWYTENHSPNVQFSMKVIEHLYTGKSDFQKIDVLQTCGVWTCSHSWMDLVMVTEKDEFIYHDMITHVAMATNPDIKKVLVIGAGDGGTIRELTKYRLHRTYRYG